MGVKKNPPKKKYPSPKKPPARKRRANTMLADNNEASSSSPAAAGGVATVDVPATPAPKAPTLRLVMASRGSTTPSLRLNGPKPPLQQRPDPITDSFLELIRPSPSLSSQLPDTLDSMPPPDLPLRKRRSIDPGPSFSQMLTGETVSLTGRSESPCFQRSSQSSFTARIRASVETPPDTSRDSNIDSQVTYDDVEDREERRRAQEAFLVKNSQRSHQQQKKKNVIKPRIKTKAPNSPKDTVIVDSPSEEEEEAIPYKLNVESFWEAEKIAFNTEIQKLKLGGEHPQLDTLSATQDGKAREYASSFGHISYYRLSLVATPSYGSLAATKQKHFSIPKTEGGEYRQTLKTILQELLDWKDKKELQIDLVYRYARNKSGVIDKEPAAVKTTATIITHSGRTQSSRNMSIADIPTALNPTGRLLNAQAVEDEINPVVIVRRDIRARWKCHKKDCDSQNYPEPTCYVNESKDLRRHYPITPQDLASWSAAIQEDRTGRLTVEQPPISLVVSWERKHKNKQRNEVRKKKNERQDDDIQETRHRLPPPATAPVITIIQLPPQSTPSTGTLTDIRTSRLEAELAARGHFEPHRSVSRAYSRQMSRGMTSAPEQRASSPVHVDIEDFIEDMKLQATSHDLLALDDAKNILMDKHYKSHHIQKWKGDEFEHKWEKLGIEPGIGRDLADHIDAFRRRKKPARARSPIHSPRSPTISTSRSARPILDSVENEDCAQRQSHQEQLQEEDEDEDYSGQQFDKDEITFEGDGCS